MALPERKNRQRGGGGGEGRGISQGVIVDVIRPTQFNVIVSELPEFARERELEDHMRKAGVVKFESIKVRCIALHYLALLLIQLFPSFILSWYRDCWIIVDRH